MVIMEFSTSIERDELYGVEQEVVTARVDKFTIDALFLQEFIHKQIDRIDCKNHTLNA
jgi:hypothetical protein